MIVKMKFLSITGPKADIDRVVNTYLSKYEIHLENALTELSTMQNITPYIQINPYKETLKQAEDFTGLLPEDKRTTTKRLSLEDAINCVHGLDHTLGQLNQERTELEAKKKDLMEKAQKIEPFQDLHCNLSSILDFHFIKFRFGKISRHCTSAVRKRNSSKNAPSWNNPFWMSACSCPFSTRISTASPKATTRTSAMTRFPVR